MSQTASFPQGGTSHSSGCNLLMGTCVGVRRERMFPLFKCTVTPALAYWPDLRSAAGDCLYFKGQMLIAPPSGTGCFLSVQTSVCTARLFELEIVSPPLQMTCWITASPLPVCLESCLLSNCLLVCVCPCESSVCTSISPCVSVPTVETGVIKSSRKADVMVAAERGPELLAHSSHCSEAL